MTYLSFRHLSAKPSNKSIVIDETRRTTYDISEEHLSLKSDPVLDVFAAEPKELVNVCQCIICYLFFLNNLFIFMLAQLVNCAFQVGVHANHEYAYARSLARFAGSLGAQGWRIASEYIQKALPAEVKYDRGWVGEYESLLPSVLIVNDQPRNLKISDGNMRRNASLPGDNESFRQNNPKDMSLSLLNRIDTGNNVVGVPGPLESPELKPRIFGVTAEPLHRSTDALSPRENHRVTGNVAKARKRSNEQMRKCNSSSSACPLEMQPQKPECPKSVASGVIQMPSFNKVTGQPRSFFQPPEAVGTQQISKSNIPIESAPQRLECAKGAPSGGRDIPSSNGQPKAFFQSQEASTPPPRSEATWVYHGRPGDGKVGTSNKSRPSTSVGFISNNQSVNAAKFAMNLSGQKNFSEHAKSVGSAALPGQANIPNRGHDVPRNMFSAFPAPVRENQSIPAPAAQSWISFGASLENKPAIVNPTFLESNPGWKMPFGNAHPPDDAKTSAVPQFFRQPVQVVRESPAQNKGLVIFPQLVQTDFSRSQGQTQWQGLVPHLQQKPSKDVLRPDLNIGFPSPGSPPARQSSGINLEAQQPDLALQL
jgi:bromodomain-containing protein 9